MPVRVAAEGTPRCEPPLDSRSKEGAHGNPNGPACDHCHTPLCGRPCHVGILLRPLPLLRPRMPQGRPNSVPSDLNTRVKKASSEDRLAMTTFVTGTSTDVAP